MVTFVPTKAVVEHLRQAELLQAWAEICKDLAVANVTPARGYETRLRMCGTKYEAFVEPGTYEGHEAHWIVFLRPREDVVTVPRQQQVVGHEAKAHKYGKSYGAGHRWPTTWSELKSRIEGHPGAKLVPGGKHLAVTLHGKHVQTLPATASDHRALLNACQLLRAAGIDVRR